MSLRFGLFGTGHWAEATQGAALAAHPEVQFVGVWGRNRAKARAVAQRYGVRPYDEVDALLADVDAVAVALPPHVQAGIAIRAAEAGKHLLLDKPLALAVEDADRIVTTVRERGLASVVFFTNRFYPTIAAFLDEAVRSGDWHGARATMFASIFETGSPYGKSPWRREKGGLWDVGPHALSILLPVFGPVAQVAAMDGPRGTVHLMLRHDGGAATTLSLTLDAPPAARAFEFVFYGATGVASVPGSDGTPVEAFSVAVDQLIADAVSGAGNACDVGFGRDVVRILAAAETARAEGRTVRVAR